MTSTQWHIDRTGVAKRQGAALIYRASHDGGLPFSIRPSEAVVPKILSAIDDSVGNLIGGNQSTMHAAEKPRWHSTNHLTSLSRTFLTPSLSLLTV